VRDLKERKVWCIWSAPKKQFVSAKDSSPASVENLVTWAEAAECMHQLLADRYPPDHSVALSLDAGACIAVSLLNAWDESRQQIEEGGAVWVRTLNSYVEKCHRSLDGVSLRIICKGQLPEGPRRPARVQIQTTGICTLTTWRIPAQPPWRQADDGGIIRDCTDALAELLVPKKPTYIQY
jgi:primase-polymerase (primpol)-like protein